MVIRRHSSAPFHLPICLQGLPEQSLTRGRLAPAYSVTLCAEAPRGSYARPTAALFGLLHHEPWAGGHPAGRRRGCFTLPGDAGVISATLASRARLSSSICARFPILYTAAMPAQGLGVARRHGICPRPRPASRGVCPFFEACQQPCARRPALCFHVPLKEVRRRKA